MASTVVVQEWISAHGGSENVAEIMADALDADVYTLWREDPSRFSRSSVTESALARWSLLRHHKALALPLMPATWRRADLSAYDRVVISSHAFAHQVADRRCVGDATPYVYVHTPARYIWSPEHDHRGSSLAARLGAPPLRRLDRRRVRRDASFACNSEFVRGRIRRAWDVDAQVIHPPASVALLQEGAPWSARVTGAESDLLATLPGAFVLGASRFVEYKRVEEAIAVGEALELPVVLAGAGPMRDALEQRGRRATVPVTLVEAPSSPLLYALYERASLFVFAPVEDFGIMPVEAMALGTPVLVNAVGGAVEAVALVRGGASSDFASAAARREGATLAMKASSEEMRTRVRVLDEAGFRERLEAWVGDD